MLRCSGRLKGEYSGKREDKKKRKSCGNRELGCGGGGGGCRGGMKESSDLPENRAGRKKKREAAAREKLKTGCRNTEKGEKRRGRRERGGFRSPSLSPTPPVAPQWPPSGPILLQVATSHSALAYQLLDPHRDHKPSSSSRKPTSSRTSSSILLTGII